MKTLILNASPSKTAGYQLLGIIMLSLAFWWAATEWLGNFTTLAVVDSSIWQLMVLGFLLWLISQLLNLYVFGKLLKTIGLPEFTLILSQFSALTLWQKYILYFALFALWWLAMLLSMMAIL